MHGHTLTVLPATAPFDSRAEVPQPLGLVGAHRSRRIGDGSEFSGIRPFHAGDRLRRINWRVSLRSGSLHVVTTRSEEDSAVLHRRRRPGRARRLRRDRRRVQLAWTSRVRAAAALAEHHVRRGDRVGLRVLGAAVARTWRLRRRGAGTCAGCTGRWRGCGRASRVTSTPSRLRFRAGAGTVVIVLSPMLHEVVVTATAALAGRGLPVIVVDTLPDGHGPGRAAGHRPRDRRPGLADAAHRPRQVLFARLSRIGCPVVPWRGPGTLDDVLHRLARRAQLPQVRAR